MRISVFGASGGIVQKWSASLSPPASSSIQYGMTGALHRNVVVLQALNTVDRAT
jgi:hypothetical protein